MRRLVEGIKMLVDRQTYLLRVSVRFTRRFGRVPRSLVQQIIDRQPLHFALTCPRCDAQLIEHLPSQIFKRWWECPDCWGAFEMYRSTLIFGRTLSVQNSRISQKMEAVNAR
jgi:ribosomal protein L37AE/L43A